MTARRKPEAMMSVKQPFDPEKFNFNKVQDKEVVFQASPPPGAEPGSSAAGLFRALHFQPYFTARSKARILSILHNLLVWDSDDWTIKGSRSSTIES